LILFNDTLTYQNAAKNYNFFIDFKLLIRNKNSIRNIHDLYSLTIKITKTTISVLFCLLLRICRFYNGKKLLLPSLLKIKRTKRR